MEVWEVTKGEGRRSFLVSCDVDTMGQVTLTCKYPDRPHQTAPAVDPEVARALVEAWDGQGSIHDLFLPLAGPEPGRIPCPDCDRDYANESTLERHREEAHGA